MWKHEASTVHRAGSLAVKILHITGRVVHFMPSDYKKTRYSEEHNLRPVSPLPFHPSLISVFPIPPPPLFFKLVACPLTAIMRYEGMNSANKQIFLFVFSKNMTNQLICCVHGALCSHRSASGLLSHSSSTRTRYRSSSLRSPP